MPYSHVAAQDARQVEHEGGEVEREDGTVEKSIAPDGDGQPKRAASRKQP